MIYTLEQAATEARLALHKLHPEWQCSIVVHQAMTYSVGQGNADSPRLDALHVYVAPGPITQASIDALIAQVRHEASTREQRNRTSRLLV